MKIYLIIILTCFVTTLNAQIFDAETCGNKELSALSLKSRPWYGNNQYLYDYLDSIGYSQNTKNVMYNVPVKFWVYTKKNKKGGYCETDVKRILNYLNYYNALNNTGFRFYCTNEISYIKSDRHYELGFLLEGPIQTLLHKENGCINVFITKHLTMRNLRGKKKKYFGVHNRLSKAIILQQGGATATLAHEIGHYFGLDHPHKHWKRGKRKQESVSRTRKVDGIFRKGLNCEKNGDGLCDTPAEPNLGRYSSDLCKFTGKYLTDSWGDRYKPNMTNLMSYTRNRECRDLFTKGQIAIMLSYAKKNKYGKYWSVKNRNSYKYNFDVFEPDNHKSTASEIFGKTPQIHSFHKVFSGKKHKSQDKIDWLFFDVNPSFINRNKKTTKSYILRFTKNKYHFSKIEVTVYNGSKEISKTIISDTKQGEIKLGYLKTGRYYIQITKLDNYNNIADYKISLLQI